MNKTIWTNDVVTAVLRGDITISGLNVKPYAVDDHAITGGPVLRGPWGSIGLMNRDENWTRAADECRRLNAAHVHGFLSAARAQCEANGCAVSAGFCSRCGGCAAAPLMSATA